MHPPATHRAHESVARGVQGAAAARPDSPTVAEDRTHRRTQAVGNPQHKHCSIERCTATGPEGLRRVYGFC
jgi:hypothetical protein